METKTMALVPLTDAQDRYYAKVLREHQNQRENGRCAVCGVPVCPKWIEAKAARAMGGRDNWDPIRERAAAIGQGS